MVYQQESGNNIYNKRYYITEEVQQQQQQQDNKKLKVTREMTYQSRDLSDFLTQLSVDQPENFTSYGLKYFSDQAVLHLNKNDNGSGSAARGSIFKSPFVDCDPHTTHEVGLDDNHSKSNSDIFKGGFNVGSQSSRNKDAELDPMAPVPAATHSKNDSLGGSGANMFGSYGMGNSNGGNETSESRDNNNSTSNNDDSPSSGGSGGSGGNGSKKVLPSNFNAQRRTSVSGETIQPEKDDKELAALYETINKNNKKTPEQLQRLSASVGENFLFKKLDTDSKKLVITALVEKFIARGETIIKQGDEGDYFYIVENGQVEFYVNGEKVNTSGSGSSFGELALMYNSPRAATVVAATDCNLWCLDRLTFRKILLGGSFKKRLMYDEFLKNLPLLSKLSTYDRAKLADALNTEFYNKGDVIIKEGDIGENFYFIEYGSALVLKKSEEKPLTTLTKGSYFGEIALLNDLPRQATVMANEDTKVVTLGKSGFQRLLGPCVDVLKTQDPTRK